MGTRTVRFKINKKDNTLSVKAKPVSIKASDVKNGPKEIIMSRAITITRRGQGTVIYSKSSGSNRLSVNKRIGVLIVEKGTKPGTYTAKIKVAASGNANYNSVTKTVTVKVIVN